jgi:GMP synthase (glutamine-hydrolysing)
MKRAIAIRHVHFEDLGAFAAPLEASGYKIQYCDLGVCDLHTLDPVQPDLLVVLGGPVSVYEEDRYPFLVDELTLLRSRIEAARPTIGICLGAQLIARALGARVYPGPAKEIGWSPLRLTEAGKAGPLRHFANTPVLHWHGDTFDLPEGAQLLASTPLYQHQAFLFGQNVIGFQFHPEADGRAFERWLVGHAVEIASVPGLSVSALRADTSRYSAAAAMCGQRCLLDWLQGLAV